MPSYKVTYFNIKGLAEPIRFLLNHGGVDFVDERMNEEDWKRIKPTTPFGQVPILEVDGKKINQSTAICRYLAKQFGLTGKDDWENLEIDAAVDTINDMRVKITSPHYEKVAEAKAQKIEQAKQVVPFILERLEEQVKRNGGYFVGGKLTWADLYFVSLLDMFNFRSGEVDILKNKPHLKALEQKVLQLPNIKAWVEKRPKSDF
ncbi:glutathione S-transferase S2 [Nasonia vitripennis]|uniref:glutathione transferase n=1 Tax=Nasonia vitripennis TaxID=7425 RepID=A0A7M6UDH8_NASVI|nr:glutathione S-transferase S2 [Nasonia vitripennis]NP_001165919.1 glutathione S-transferase S2 [Nasonia vitripennis]